MGLFGFINSCLINIVGRSVGRSIVCVCVWEWCLFFCVVRYRDSQQNVRTAFGKIHVPQMPSIIIVGGSSHRLRSAEIDMGFIFIDVSFAPATAVTHGRTSFFFFVSSLLSFLLYPSIKCFRWQTIRLSLAYNVLFPNRFLSKCYMHFLFVCRCRRRRLLGCAIMEFIFYWYWWGQVANKPITFMCHWCMCVCYSSRMCRTCVPLTRL